MAPRPKSRTAGLKRLLEDKLKEQITSLKAKMAELEGENHILTNNCDLAMTQLRAMVDARHNGLQSAVATAQLVQRLGVELERCANTGLAHGPIMDAQPTEGLSFRFGPLQPKLSDRMVSKPSS